MDSSKSKEVNYEFLPFLQVYKDGRVERFIGTDFIPPSIHPETGVSSKDVIIVPETGVSARIYLPMITSETHEKRPLLIYIHGGCFCFGSAFSGTYHNYLNSLVAEANVVAVSIEYRLAPEHHLPIAYEDSWAAIQWVLSDSWLQGYVDLERVFLAGDSSGANIVHNMAMRAGDVTNPVNLLGVALIQPYFWGKERIGSEGAFNADKLIVPNKMWTFAYPSTIGYDDPLVNPFAAEAPSLSDLGCTHVLVFVTDQDVYRDRGWLYYETLRKSNWRGVVQIMETEGEDHVFHLFSPTSQKALDMIKRLGSFLNQDKCAGIM